MLSFILARAVSAVPVLIIVSMLTFAGLEFVPGDPLTTRMGTPENAVSNLSLEEIERMREEMGLTGSLPVRYARHVERLLHGDLGRSLVNRRPVMETLQQRIGVSAWLSGVTLLTSVTIGITLGLIGGLRPHSWTDLIVTFLAVAGVAAPGFWLAILLIIVFSVNLGWLPPAGWVSPMDNPIQAARYMVLPVLTLGLVGAAAIMRQMRSSILEVMRQDFITTASAKGLASRQVVLRHAMKNALLPVITIMGLQVSSLLGGSVVIERVFSIPGIGRLALDAIANGDFPLLQGIVFVATIAVLVGNLLADIAYAYLDPRIRYR